MGGEERLARHRSTGKLDARARLARLFDPGTFVELGALVGNEPEPGAPHAPADALVGGIGAIDGRSADWSRRGLHGAGWLHRDGRVRQALSPRATCRSREGPARLHARGCRASCRQCTGGAPAQRPPGARRFVGSRANGVPGARSVGRARGAHGAAVRLRRDDPSAAPCSPPARRWSRRLWARTSRRRRWAARASMSNSPALSTTLRPTTRRRSTWPDGISHTSR